MLASCPQNQLKLAKEQLGRPSVVAGLDPVRVSTGGQVGYPWSGRGRGDSVLSLGSRRMLGTDFQGHSSCPQRMDRRTEKPGIPSSVLALCDAPRLPWEPCQLSPDLGQKGRSEAGPARSCSKGPGQLAKRQRQNSALRGGSSKTGSPRWVWAESRSFQREVGGAHGCRASQGPSPQAGSILSFPFPKAG